MLAIGEVGGAIFKSHDAVDVGLTGFDFVASHAEDHIAHASNSVTAPDMNGR